MENKDFIEILRDKGIRPTPHRVRIAQKVLRKHNHFTADEISDWATSSKTKLSRATVYNILNEFVAVGLLKSMHLGSAGKTIYDSNTSDHVHLYDLGTGKIHDVDSSVLKLDLSSLGGYKIEEVSVVLAGRKA